jgi:hypothetical protein
MQTLDAELQEQLIRYLLQEISLSQLWDWFMPLSWDVDRVAEPATAELAHDLESLLYEYSDGMWTEPELRAKIAHITPIVSRGPSPEVRVYADSTTPPPVTGRVEVPGLRVDELFSVAPGL